MPSFSLPKILLRLPMRLMLTAIRAEFLHLDALGRGALVLCLTVIAVLALTALQLDNFTRHYQLFSFLLLGYDRISVTVPAPTVRPPSRIAKRKPLSIATGVINSTSTDTLSPGITISMPSGSFATPVTSVVRK